LNRQKLKSKISVNPTTPLFGDLTQQRALVTGSSTGIGRAIAIELARAGADVVIHCRQSVEAAEEVQSEILSLNRLCEIVTGDLADLPEIEDFAERSWQALGSLDICVNNAGADILTGSSRTLEFSDKLQQLFEVDLRGTMLLSRDIGRRMREAGRGVILNVGWDQSDRGMEGDSGELFSAIKNGIMGFTRSLALSLAPEVRVNCIAPGWIRTAWGEQASTDWQDRVLAETPLKRWGTPEDIAHLARFLVSNEAAYLTGQVINANGGAVR